MPETSQLYLGLEAESGETATGFQGVLNQLRESATSTYLIHIRFSKRVVHKANPRPYGC